MTDPITRLNAALEGRYRIESELGEGGMAVLLTMAITEYVACASIPATNMAGLLGLGCRRTLRIQRNTPHE